jgi:hypothetical protein
MNSISSVNAHLIIVSIRSRALASGDINSQSRSVSYQRVRYLKQPRNDVSHAYNLSLLGMQLPDKYEENFDVSSEGPSSGVIMLLTSSTIFVTVTKWSSPFLFEGNPFMPLTCVDGGPSVNKYSIINKRWLLQDL